MANTPTTEDFQAQHIAELDRQLAKKDAKLGEYKTTLSTITALSQMGLGQTEWISVKDRLPVCDHTTILAYFDDGDIVIWSSCKLSAGKEYVTHWMPIPEPPLTNTNE